MCRIATVEVATLTGFDRVMAYRFDRDDHGHVLAETKRDDLEPFLGLHYPAGDIPAQARRLYVISPLRLIPDVGYTPAALVAAAAEGARARAPLDLSLSVLRSVSPIHVQYLGNMGVRASLSISLVNGGRLWGMIICHHYSPRFVPYELRAAAELLAQTLSAQVATREQADLAELRAAAQKTLGRVAQALSSSDDATSILARERETMLSVVTASSAAVRSKGVWTRLGDAPSTEELASLPEDVLRGDPQGIVFTDALGRVFPPSEAWRDRASGLLSMELSADGEELLVFFRPEEVRHVDWAGDPDKSSSVDADGRLSPRGSFAVWRETVRGRSLPWEPWQLEAAADLRRRLTAQAMRRSADLAAQNATLERSVVERTADLTAARDELTRHGEELTRSNAELERFAYVASHDLQEPLRMVVSYVQLLSRRYRGKLDSDADEFIAFAVDGAKRMQTLINDLLAYSRVGKGDLVLSQIDLAQVFATVEQNLAVAITDAEAVVTQDALPTVTGNAAELGQVLQNLISNGLKFRGQAPARVHVSARRRETEWVIEVRDEGIGIAPEQVGRIFIVFQRLHTRTEIAGSGIGLAISRKIIERRGGRLWVSSTPGGGSSFFFSLPDAPRT